jgi:hypothetical protein
LGERLITPVLSRLHKPTPDLQALLVSFWDDAHQLVHQKWRPLLATNSIAQLTPLLVLFLALVGLGAYPGQITLVEVFAADQTNISTGIAQRELSNRTSTLLGESATLSAQSRHAH